jgi:hypothetical protein
MAIKGLSADQSERLREAILQRESSGNYQAVNQLGFIGGYQFGAPALEDLGYIKKGASKGGNSALDNPNNWTIPGGKQAFLSNPTLQDQAFQKLANRNYDTLNRIGVINPGSSSTDVGGALATSHLLGPGGARDLSKGIVKQDANGTKATEYNALGKNAVSGSKTAPDPKAASANAQARGGVAAPPAGNSPPPPPTGYGQKDTQVVDYSASLQAEGPLGPQTNVLEQFTSFNTVFTLSCLDNKQVNFPENAESYKNGNYGSIILRSGGGFADNRVSTAYKTEYNPEGKYEFYIDNVNIDALISFNKMTKGSNSTTITFEVFEPYSMGLFLQVLQLAATERGHSNYSTAPFLLTMEFIGYDEDGTVISGASAVNDSLNRHIPLKLQNVNMDINAAGCKYTVECYAWNEQALTDMNQLLKTDMNVSGKTVAEILQTGKNSLQYWLNARLEEIAKQGSETGKPKYTPDEVVIIFPPLSGIEDSPGSDADAQGGGFYGEETQTTLTKNPKEQQQGNQINSKLTLTRGNNAILIQQDGTLNEIGKSDMGFDVNTGGESKPASPGDSQPDPNKPVLRKANYYDPKDKVFRFPQNTSIVNAITEILLMSDYCKKSVEAPSDKLGMKRWFRIETQVYNQDSVIGDDGKARIPKLIVYRVVPYLVHEMRFAAPTAQPKGYEELKKYIVKEYNYIYTGKNVDILDFNIQLNTGMFTTAYSDKNALAKDVLPQYNGVSVERTSQPTSATSGSTTSEPGTPQPSEGEFAQRHITTGGGVSDDYRTLIAKNFQDALLNSQTDMVTVEMTIMGDPYYIADSGLGNFNADISRNLNVNSNGSMNYQSGEVDILVNFRTPIDYNPSTGEMDFGNTIKVEGFSGLYQVTEVTNNFAGGKFSQLLKMIRRRNQNPQKEEEAPKVDRGSEAIIGEDGKVVKGIRRNTETGELYNSEGLYEDDGVTLTTIKGEQPRKAVDSGSNKDGTDQTDQTPYGTPMPGQIIGA